MQHRGEAAAGPGGADGGDRDHDAHHGLQGGVPGRDVRRDPGGGDQRGPRQQDDGQQHRCEVDRQRAGLHHGGAAPREAVDDGQRGVVRPVGVDAAQDAARAPLQQPHRLTGTEQRCTERQGQRRPAEGGVDAVPQREVLRLRTDLVGRRVGLHQRVGQTGQQPEHQPRHAEHDDRGEQAGSGRPHDGVRDTGLARERPPDEAGAVGRGQHRAEQYPGQDERIAQQRLQRRLLGHEAEQRGCAGHRQRGEDRDHGEQRRAPADAGQQSQVTGACGVVDHADDQEQRGLEQPVGQQQGGPGERGLPRPGPEQDHEEPELADRAERQDPLEVALAQRPPPADDHGGQTDGEHDRAPHADHREGRCEPGDEVDAGLDHRGSVQVRRDRGRGRHRRGQPRVEGDLGALGEGTDQDEEQGDRDRAAGGRVGQHRGERGRPRLLHQQDEAQQHDQPPERGHEQRLLGRPPALGVGVVEADEQPGRDAGELPEDVQQQQVVGQDEPEHGAGETGQDPGEATQPGLPWREVPGAVGDDQRSDTAHEHHHQQRQRIQAQAQRQTQARHPGPGGDHRTAVQHRRGLRRRPPGRGRRRQGDDQEDPAAEPRGHSRGGQREHQVQQQQRDQLGLRGRRDGRPPRVRVLRATDQTSRLSAPEATGPAHPHPVTAGGTGADRWAAGGAPRPGRPVGPTRHRASRTRPEPAGVGGCPSGTGGADASCPHVREPPLEGP